MIVLRIAHSGEPIIIAVEHIAAVYRYEHKTWIVGTNYTMPVEETVDDIFAIITDYHKKR